MNMPIGVLNKVAATAAIKISYRSPSKITTSGLLLKTFTNLVNPVDIEFAKEIESSFLKLRSILFNFEFIFHNI